jgi:hypothetical protein
VCGVEQKNTKYFQKGCELTTFFIFAIVISPLLKPKSFNPKAFMGFVFGFKGFAKKILL